MRPGVLCPRCSPPATAPPQGRCSTRSPTPPSTTTPSGTRALPALARAAHTLNDPDLLARLATDVPDLLPTQQHALAAVHASRLNSQATTLRLPSLRGRRTAVEFPRFRGLATLCVLLMPATIVGAVAHPGVAELPLALLASAVLVIQPSPPRLRSFG